MTPEASITLAAKLYDLAPEDLVGRGRRSYTVTEARASAVRIGMRGGASKADMARALGIDWSSVHSLARRVEMP